MVPNHAKQLTYKKNSENFPEENPQIPSSPPLMIKFFKAKENIYNYRSFQALQKQLNCEIWNWNFNLEDL